MELFEDEERLDIELTRRKRRGLIKAIEVSNDGIPTDPEVLVVYMRLLNDIDKSSMGTAGLRTRVRADKNDDDNSALISALLKGIGQSIPTPGTNAMMSEEPPELPEEFNEEYSEGELALTNSKLNADDIGAI